MGVIYILTNPSFPDYVKLGYADNLEKRLKQLNQSECMPFAFRVYAKYEVEKRLRDLDLHALIDKLNPELRSIDEFDGKPRIREFYAMTPEDAYEILECIAKISGTEDKLYRMKPEGHEILDEEIAKEIIDIKKPLDEMSQNGKNIMEYWTAFHNYIDKNIELNFRKQFTAIRMPYPERWSTCSLGTCDYHLEMIRHKNKNAISACIACTDEIFDRLFEYKEEIEEEYNIEYEWDKKDNRKTQYVKIFKDVPLLNKNDWDSQFKWLTENLLNLKHIVIKYSKIEK